MIARLKVGTLFFLLSLAAFALAKPAWAAPKVVTTIRPVQAMVLAVTGEIGVPDVLMDAGASPHGFAMKPSQAAMLEDADVVFWVGEPLETALAGRLADLEDAHVVSLLDAPGLDLMQYADGGDEHGHGPVDPHVWLAPENIIVLTDYIRDELIRINPGNGDIYTQNAKVAQNRMRLFQRQGAKVLEPVKDVPYMVQHDGFGYLAREFGLNEVGHLQTLPGMEPGARHVAQVVDTIAERGVVCLFHEPQFTPALARRLKDETGVRLAEIDPMGAGLAVSETLSVRILQEITLAMTTCLYTLTDDPQSN